jgi:hypothetical protein
MRPWYQARSKAGRIRDGDTAAGGIPVGEDAEDDDMGRPTNTPIDIPDADAAEQARELRDLDPPATILPTGPGPAEVDEFDAVEQSLVVEDDEDDYR